MSINVRISLDRKSAVFLAGECLSVQVSFFNNDSQQKSLAWCCVQLHCEEHFSAAAQKFSEKRQNQSSTAVVRAKQAIFSSEPAILFCDLRIEPSGSHCFETSAQIPLNLPPTFKGNFVRYSWYISVATQQVDAPIKMVQLPIRVLNVGVDVSEVKQRESIENPFLRNDFKNPSVVDVTVNRIEEVCAIRKQRVYEIKSGGTIFATVLLYKNVFKLGDDVIGKFDFPQDEVKCLQVLVRAEIVETSLASEKSDENVQSCNTEHMITAFVRETHFKLQLPMTAVPSFTTESVKVRWRLRFEFVTTAQRVMQQQADGELFKLAEDLDIETMKWDLPISVLTCNPFNSALICLQPSTTSFSISKMTTS